MKNFWKKSSKREKKNGGIENVMTPYFRVKYDLYYNNEKIPLEDVLVNAGIKSGDTIVLEKRIGNITNKTRELTELNYDTFKDIISADEIDLEGEKEIADLVIEYIKSRREIPEENIVEKVEIKVTKEEIKIENEENKEEEKKDEEQKEEEKKDNKPQKPVTKAEILAEKEYLRKITVRMPKKILEAKARKKNRLNKRLQKIWKKTKIQKQILKTMKKKI